MDFDDDNLFCDEVLMMEDNHEIIMNKTNPSSKEDCEDYFQICLNNELDFMPQFGYVTHLRSSGLLFSRFRSVQSIIRSRCRLNLSFETVFNAANYFDRFISIIQCHGWNDWMIDLLSVACLSVASKFGETEAHTLHEIQMEGLKLSYCFEARLIQRMELSLMKVLKWRLRSITAFSYVELLLLPTWRNMSSNHDFLLFKQRSTDLLLTNLLDTELVEFRPSVVATASLMCIIKKRRLYDHREHDDYLGFITGLIPRDQMDDLIKCQKRINDDHPIGDGWCYGTVVPSSPNTVLGRDDDQPEISEQYLVKTNMIEFRVKGKKKLRIN